MSLVTLLKVMQEDSSEKNRYEQNIRVAEACLVMRISQIKYLSYRSELFIEPAICPTVICFKILVKIANA